MYIGVKSVSIIDEYKLLLVFENDEKKVFDITPYLEIGLFSQLKYRKTFNSVRISFDTIEWVNGLDLDPEILYAESIPFN